MKKFNWDDNVFAIIDLCENLGYFCADCVEGSLIDNYLYDTGDGWLAIFERFLNSWSSGYRCEYAEKSDENGTKALFNAWYACRDAWEAVTA